MDNFKNEELKLKQLGVFLFQQEWEWISPTFMIPKNNITVIIISDFGDLKTIKHIFSVPKTSDVLQKFQCFQFTKVLWLNMGYFNIGLDPMASKICTIILSWGKYSYTILPMGIVELPENFQ